MGYKVYAPTFIGGGSVPAPAVGVPLSNLFSSKCRRVLLKPRSAQFGSPDLAKNNFGVGFSVAVGAVFFFDPFTMFDGAGAVKGDGYNPITIDIDSTTKVFVFDVSNNGLLFDFLVFA